MDMDKGMGSLKDNRKDRGKDHHLDQDQGASIESCPALLENDEIGDLRKIVMHLSITLIVTIMSFLPSLSIPT